MDLLVKTELVIMHQQHLQPMKFVKILELMDHVQQKLMEGVLLELLVQLQQSEQPVLRIIKMVIVFGLELHVLIRYVQMHQLL